jgi:aspartate/tyrosine/aromatic aminotransferase
MFFDQVREGAPDPVFGLLGTYQADTRPMKMSLMVGIYRDEQLKSELIQAVWKGEERITASDRRADYLPFDGVAKFGELIGGLVFGDRLWGECRDRIYAAQAVGGTGALRLGAEFLVQEVGKRVWIPDPTWPNHRGVFERSGMKVETLEYYNSEIHRFDAQRYMEGLSRLAPNSIVLFHAVCHNPTGSDPTLKDWEAISDLCRERKLVPFFDCAYQGFGSGIEEDTAAIRLFLERGHEFLVAYSCSKNFSLYSQRVGALFVVSKNSDVKQCVGSQIKRIIRTLYSNPPSYGAGVVAEVLGDPKLRREWMSELEQMRQRIVKAREMLVDRLIAKSGRVDFRFVRNHRGMFSYLDLSKEQVLRLIDQYAIYTLDHGRINVAGLTDKNIDYFVDGVIAVCES